MEVINIKIEDLKLYEKNKAHSLFGPAAPAAAGTNQSQGRVRVDHGW